MEMVTERAEMLDDVEAHQKLVNSTNLVVLNIPELITQTRAVRKKTSFF